MDTPNSTTSLKNPDHETWSLDSYRIAVGFGTISLLLGYIQIKLQTPLFHSAPVIAHGSLVAGTVTIISLVRLPTFSDKNLRQILRYAANISGSLWAILLLLVLSPIMAWILLGFWAIGAAISGSKVYPQIRELRGTENPIDKPTGAGRAAAQQQQDPQV